MSHRKVYSPESYRKAGFLSSWNDLFAGFKEYRDLTGQLIMVDLTQQYKKSVFGIGWVLLEPLLAIVLWLLLKEAGVFSPGDTGIPYAAFLLLSTTIWGFFMGFYRSISGLISTGGGVLLQTNFPHIILIVQKAVVVLINLMITFIFIFIVLLAFKVQFSWSSLLFPLTLLPLMLLGMAVGLLFAVINVVAVDLSNFFDKAMVLLMYISPVIVSRQVNSELMQNLMYFNPLTYLIDFPRQVLISGSFENSVPYLACAGISVIAFILMLRFYFRATPVIMEKITV